MEEPELTPRQCAWLKMSRLFLDTWYTPDELDDFALELSGLPFSTGELQTIFEKEVAPACGINLLDLAGEWAGFDRQWLFDRIANLSFLDRATGFTRSMTQWDEVLSRIKKQRE